jgi:hypothetical protein
LQSDDKVLLADDAIARLKPKVIQEAGRRGALSITEGWKKLQHLARPDPAALMDE